MGYKVAAYFIVQSESTEQILRRSTKHPQTIEPRLEASILCDYSEAEISSIQQAFPTKGKPFVWGTHIALKAAALYFHIPLYLCERSPKTECYEWHCFSPIYSAEKINYPQNRAYVTKSLGHFELAYYTGVHSTALCQLTQTELPRFLLN